MSAVADPLRHSNLTLSPNIEILVPWILDGHKPNLHESIIYVRVADAEASQGLHTMLCMGFKYVV